MDVDTDTKLEIIPLTKHIGAEIRGVELRQKPDAASLRTIYQAWLDHLVLVIRDQDLTQEDLVRATSYFGEIGHIDRPGKYHPPGFARMLPGIMLITNIRENGEPIGALPDGEMMFHHDMIHCEIPSRATMLYAVDIPSHGGDTLFASGCAAYETLDPALRERLEGRKAFHHYNYGSTQKGDDRGVEAFSEAAHPVFRTHDETGRKAVYVNRLMSERIVDMEQEESTRLLNALFDHSEKPEFVYTHKWRKGDLLLWDNRCSTHARTDFPSTERRLLMRTTLKGNAPPR